MQEKWSQMIAWGCRGGGGVSHVRVGVSCRGGVGHVGVDGSCHVGAGGCVSCRGVVGQVGVGWVM